MTFLGYVPPRTGEDSTIVAFELTVLPVSADLSTVTHPLICAHVERNAQPT
jgi:hypothetical protein